MPKKTPGLPMTITSGNRWKQFEKGGSKSKKVATGQNEWCWVETGGNGLKQVVAGQKAGSKLKRVVVG